MRLVDGVRRILGIGGGSHIGGRFCSRSKSVIIPSSVDMLCKSFVAGLRSVESVTFGGGCRLQRLEESAWSESELESIIIPSSVEVLCKSCFSRCASLSSVSFESGSHLRHIEELAFSLSDLTSIVIPRSVEFLDGSAFAGLHLDFIGISIVESRFRVCDSFLEDIPGRSIVRCFGYCKSVVIPSSIEMLCKFCFYWCKSLSSNLFEPGSHLQRIEELAFWPSALISIIIPSSVEVLCKSCFSSCKLLSSVLFESGSHLQCIVESAFFLSGLTSIIIVW
jgi:hypothetical protein